MPKTDPLIREFINELRLDYPRKIKKALLFGSRAKGGYRLHSDYDIFLLLAKRDNSIINKIYDKVLDYLLKYGMDLSLKIYTPEEFKNEKSMYAPFILEVERTGIDLWGKSH